MTTVAFLGPPADGSDGIGTYTGELINAFSEDVTTRHVSFPPATTNPLPLLKAAVRAVIFDSDVVHVQHEYALFGPVSLFSWPVLAVLYCSCVLTNTKLVLTMHSAWNRDTVAGEPLACIKQWYIWANNWFLVMIADHLVFLSENCCTAFRETVTLSSYSIIPHGVKAEERRSLTPAAAKAEFGYDPDTPLVVEPGYVREQKGTHVFIKIAQTLPEVEFLVAGGAQVQQAETYLKALKKRAGPNVSFTGHLSEDRFHAAFIAADVVCLPYVQMTQSGIFNWCATYETPVAAAAHDYFTRLSAEWNCVSCFDISDEEEITTTLEQLLTDSTRRERLAENLATYRDANSFRAVAAQHKELYETDQG